MIFFEWLDPFWLSIAFWISFAMGMKTGLWNSHHKELAEWRYGGLIALLFLIVPVMGAALGDSHFFDNSYEDQVRILQRFYLSWASMAFILGFFFSFNRHAASQYGYVLYYDREDHDSGLPEVAFTGFCQDWRRYRTLSRRKERELMKLSPSLKNHFYCCSSVNRSLLSYFEPHELKEFGDYLSLDDRQKSMLNDYVHHPALADFNLFQRNLSDKR